MGVGVQRFGVCPRNTTLPCPSSCQSALNELAVYCAAAQSVDPPAAVFVALGLSCATPTCALGPAAAATAGAMQSLSVPLACTSPFAAPAASAAPSWRARAQALAAAALAGAALL